MNDNIWPILSQKEKKKKNDIWPMHKILDKYHIQNRDSPRQTWVLQVLLWRLRPLQGGDLQRRKRDCCPPPQLTVQTDHWDHGSHGPTESEMEKSSYL